MWSLLQLILTRESEGLESPIMYGQKDQATNRPRVLVREWCIQAGPWRQVWWLHKSPHDFQKGSSVCSGLFTSTSVPCPQPYCCCSKVAAVSSWGLQQLPVLGSPGSASRKLVPSLHPLDSQLLHRSKKPLAALNYGSPSQAASGVAVLPTVLIACLILPLGTFPTQVRGRREEAALLCDLQLQLPNKPLHWQRIKGAGQGTKSIDSNEWIQLHLIYFIFFTRQRWQWQSIFVSSITCAMHASEMHHFSCFF